MGHRPGQRRVEEPQHVPTVTVRPGRRHRGDRLSRELLRASAVQVGPAVLLGHTAGALCAGASDGATCFDWSLPAGTKPRDLDMGDVFGLTTPKAVRLMAVPTPRLTCPLQ
ncbi:hypothetical protein B296_00001423 [Ensete ventricosum]|uniref:Uncharacterized protein n=1 Tax=Ensete ventricosum TaxID=4639 RepID=A0A427ADT7_ENSVE|nr:hypothetical protein B296_00001423 [Ensete ventricosum]